MLLDSAHIQEFEAQWRNRKNKRAGKAPFEPLYTTEDAMAVMEHFVPCDYMKEIEVCEGVENPCFTDVGHLLGLLQYRNLADGKRRIEKNRILR